MIESLARRYLTAVIDTMRQVVSAVPDAAGFATLVQYPLGWVDQDGQPYDHPTGKRIRPLLLLLCAEAAGGKWQDALPAAAAVELLHNFSLVHDDIEDGSDTRHNRPTVWLLWGQAHAINAGDALFALAYTALQRLTDTVPLETVAQVWRVFNEMCLELTRGQHLDMHFQDEPTVSSDDYLSMIQGKSAALIAACAQIGALIGGRSASTAEHMRAFGMNLGIAFQIRDDILGIWGDPIVTGKSAATDIISRKKSLPVLYGLEHSPLLNALYAKESFSETDINHAVALLDAIGARRDAEQREAYFYQAALSALNRANLNPNATRDLHRLAAFLFGRAY